MPPLGDVLLQNRALDTMRRDYRLRTSRRRFRVEAILPLELSASSLEHVLEMFDVAHINP